MKFDNARLRESFLPITEGTYTIIGTSPGPAKEKYPSIVLQLSRDDTGTKHSKLLPLPNDMNDISPRTGFGRLINAFGKDSDSWLGSKIDIKIDEQGKKHIYPIKKMALEALATT